MEKPEAAGKRFFFTARHFSNKEIARIIGDKFSGYRTFVESFDHSKGDFPSDGYYRVDSSRTKDILGINITSVKKCVVDSVNSLKGLKGDSCAVI